MFLLSSKESKEDRIHPGSLSGQDEGEVAKHRLNYMNQCPGAGKKNGRKLRYLSSSVFVGEKRKEHG